MLLTIFSYQYFPHEGEWAVPSGSARPGQPVARTEQAPVPWPICKNQFNIQAARWAAFQILSWKEQILHMILAKRPRSDNEERPNICSILHPFTVSSGKDRLPWFLRFLWQYLKWFLVKENGVAYPPSGQARHFQKRLGYVVTNVSKVQKSSMHDVDPTISCWLALQRIDMNIQVVKLV